MNRILVSIFTVTLCVTLGFTLDCYKCDIGFFGLCYTTTLTCSANQQCFSGQGKTAGVIKLEMKGCLDVALCNQTTDVHFPASSNTSIYQMTKTCCNTNLCNAATPVTYTLTLCITSLISLLLMKVLV